jgi:hypothetical protein
MIIQNNFKLASFLIFFLGFFSLHAQQVSGVVYDKKTQEPMEGVTVYFDNTTKGTITNSQGLFKLNINKDIRTSLVVSFLGYRKIVQNDYSEDKVYTFYLEEEMSVLNEVYLTTKQTPSRKNDSKSNDKEAWSRQHKLNEFKKHFLGASKESQTCKILNEDDIDIAFDKSSEKLIASSSKPILIFNKYLDYEITYELQEFEVQYVKDTIYNEIWKTTNFLYAPTSIYYEGTSFYKMLHENPSERIDKRRTEAYQGSILHFMRAIYSDSLVEQGFKFFYKKQQVTKEYTLVVNETEDPNLKEVCFLKPDIVVGDISDSYSKLTLNDEPCIYIDNFGNHSPIKAITFYDYMGNQRVGDALPLDYKPILELEE